MSSATDFTSDEEFFDDASLADPGSDVDDLSETSFGSCDSWNPAEVRDSDDEYNVPSDIEDLEFISDDSTISILANDPVINIPVVDPLSQFRGVAPTRDTKPSPELTFTGLPVGVNRDIPTFNSPSDAFESIIDEEVVESIVMWTNERAEKYFEGRDNTIVNGIKWRPVTIPTMYIFFALVMNMGVVKEPEISNYWSRHPQYGGPAIFNSKVMSRNYFINILKFLRFGSVDDADKNNQKTRIEPLLDILREKCKEHVNPGLDIAIDEALILWKGRLRFRQFIKTKRSRFGIKVFITCPGDEKFYGYSYDFQIYYGKQSKFATEKSKSASDPLSLSEEIVVAMLGDLIGCGRHVITDNWYTSLRLAEFLLTEKTDLTGIVKPNRGPPQLIKSQKLDKKGSSFIRRGDVLITKYEDRKTIYALTTRYVFECFKL